jgi:hypothetical protein
VAEFREEPRHREAVAEKGHLQRAWRKTNLQVVAPAMRNEHGTDGERLPCVSLSIETREDQSRASGTILTQSSLGTARWVLCTCRDQAAGG